MTRSNCARSQGWRNVPCPYLDDPFFSLSRHSV